MALEPWKKISEEIKFTNPWWEYRLAKFEIPSGKKIDYHYMHGKDAVVMIGVDSDGKIPLVSQYRALYDCMSLEFPMGAIEIGQTPKQAVEEEFAQEAGYKARNIERIGKFQPSNARLDDWCYVFIGHGLVEVEARPDETEEFEQERLSLAKIDELMKSGGILDGMCIAAWFLAKPKIEEILKQK